MPRHEQIRCRYAHCDDDVPDGWAVYPLDGWHGAKGYVLWSEHMTNGRAKGAQFERDVARMCHSSLGFDAKRDLEQYRSGDRGDLIGVPGWVIECKRYASGSTYRDEWWAQVTKAADAAMCEPVLIYKFDRQPVRCVVFLSAINPDYWGKDDVATVSFDTWCMIVREGLTDEDRRPNDPRGVSQPIVRGNGAA